MTISGKFDLESQSAGTLEPYRGVGADLRNNRELQGHTIEDVAQVLRISSRYIRAIEEGKFENLPGPAYVMGFLRTYSDYLGTDSKVTVDQFRSEVSGFEAKPELEFPTPPEETSVPNMPVIAGSVFAAIIVFGIWFLLDSDDQATFDAVQDVPTGFGETQSNGLSAEESELDKPPQEATRETTEFREGVGAVLPSADIATESADIGIENQSAPGDSQTLVAVGEGILLSDEAEVGASIELEELPDSGPTPQASEESAPLKEGDNTTFVESSEAITGNMAAAPDEPTLIPTPPPPPTSSVNQADPRIYGLENTNSRITLIARQDSWVQVQTAANDLLITRILYTGDSYKVPDEAGLLLITGNAGGIEVLIDGQAIPPLGPEGAVRRNIPLDPEGLRSASQPDIQ